MQHRLLDGEPSSSPSHTRLSPQPSHHTTKETLEAIMAHPFELNVSCRADRASSGLPFCHH